MIITTNKQNPNLLNIEGLTEGKILSIYHILKTEEENNPKMSVVAKDVLQMLTNNKEKFL